MKINVTTELTDYEGNLLKSGETVTTVRVAFINALNAVIPEVKDLTIEQKLRAYQLSLLMTKEEEVDFTVEDLVLIKRHLNAIYAPVVVGQLVALIDQS
jgi:hypothetical protein